MMRLQKFVEQGPNGEPPGRAAYVLRLDTLPPASPGMSWQQLSSFNAAEEILEDPDLKNVFKVAIANGFAIVETQNSESHCRKTNARPANYFGRWMPKLQ